MNSCGLVSPISGFFSTISLVSWMCAQLPQIYTNYNAKSAEGISPLFLLLWLCGDFLSFTSCLLNDVVLKFQVYLSLFFLLNDVTLCYQYYYYNSSYPRKHLQHLLQQVVLEQSVFSGESETHKTDNIHIRHKRALLLESSSLTPPDGPKASNFGSVAIVGAAMQAGVAQAQPILKPDGNAVTTGAKGASGVVSLLSIANHASVDSIANIGLVLAWGCTFVYMSSRCPQLYKNYKRKSVEGVSPLLFGSALMGNLTYTMSILTSCDFLYDSNKTEFFWRQLPYILGSAGTIVFDMAYFYQRYLYRNAGANNTVMGLEPWTSA